MSKCISCGGPLDYPSGDGCAAMTKHKEKTVGYVTGQIYGWNGGKCPVHPKTRVEVWLRNCVGPDIEEAGIYLWEHSDTDSDIVCFQVITPYAEPKVIWVNEYGNGQMLAYNSENEARNRSLGTYVRTAVKFVEEKK